ncbi:hypothetical protein BAJUN_00100 [Bajunvirus bajun]|uniref:Uncharacterized protein n=1 Tax=Brevundimonas phage vB_BgoS-Bajun TaxID=2948594 RepID=A0A9E7N5V6_9CAUD|nr:hypothetical protein BAJUN_00100 [Brevundimonas phage vB_BgoS-Bajun]
MAKDNLCLEVKLPEADYAGLEARMLAHMVDLDIQRAAIDNLMRTASLAPLIVGIDPAGPGDSVGFAISAPTNIPAKHLKTVKDAADTAEKALMDKFGGGIGMHVSTVRPNGDFLPRMLPMKSNASPSVEPMLRHPIMTAAMKRSIAAMIKDPYRGVVSGRMSHQMPNPMFDRPLTLELLDEARRKMVDINRPRRYETIAEEQHARRGQILGDLSRELPREMPRLQFGKAASREEAVHPDVAQAFLWGPQGEWTGLIRPACLRSPFDPRGGRGRHNDTIDLRDFTRGASPGIALKVFLVTKDGLLQQVDPSMPAHYAHDMLHQYDRDIRAPSARSVQRIIGRRDIYPDDRHDPRTALCFYDRRGWEEWHANIHDRGYNSW